MTEEGELYAGLTNRGWSSLGDSSYGIQRLEWTGETPFEIHHIEAKPYGFDLVLTDDVDAGSLVDSNAIEDFLVHVPTSPYLQERRRSMAAIASQGSWWIRTIRGSRCAWTDFENCIHEIRCRGLRSAW
ncbi:MAG: hypothetical protein R3B96_18755 [Pirellulaceae bacterium]